MTIEHLSYSSITSYLSCARAWAYKYVEKQPTYATPELAYGSAVHGTVEAWLQDSSKEPKDYWLAAWTKATEQQIVWGADTPEQYYNDGIKLLGSSTVLAGLATIRQREVKHIERKIELRVPGVPIPIVGYIDLIDGAGVPGDFKTSGKSWTQARATGETQSLFYLAALNQLGETVPSWEFRHYVFVKTKTPQYQEFTHRHKPMEAIWLFGMIRRVWEGIAAGVYPENPTSWKCSPEYCDFWSKCRGKYL